MTRQDHRGHGERRRLAAMAAVALTVALAASGCNNGDDGPDAVPPETSPATPTESPTPTQDPDAWRSKYNPKELKAYDAALQRWEEYESRSEPIWSKGKATPAAEALFKEYWVSWGTEWNRLDLYEQNDITVSGTAEVLWSRADSFDFGARRVLIEQCIDPSVITTLVNGKPPEKQRALGPYVRTLTLDKVASTDTFKVAAVRDETTMKKVRPCDS